MQFLKEKFNNEENLDDLHQELLNFFQKNKENYNEETIKIRENYMLKYPNRQEEIVLIFDLLPSLKTSRELENKLKKFDKNTLRKMYEELTEFQYLFTHFLLTNTYSEKDLRSLWKLLKNISEIIKEKEKFNSIKRGIITQTAVFKILKELNLNPNLSTPKEDAFDSIDIRLGDEGLVQVKNFYEPQILATKYISYPIVTTHNNNKEIFFNSRHFFEAQKFKRKIEKYNQKTGKRYQTYIVFIPSKSIDQFTGNPHEDLIKLIKEQWKNLKENRKIT